MKYKTKIGYTKIVIFILFAFAWSYFMFKLDWIKGIIILSVPLFFTIYLPFAISYTIKDDMLMISYGFLYKQAIEITKISEIRRLRSDDRGHPAPSSDRLKITYRLSNVIMVSPQEKDAFIRHLQAINPSIRIL